MNSYQTLPQLYTQQVINQQDNKKAMEWNKVMTDMHLLNFFKRFYRN